MSHSQTSPSLDQISSSGRRIYKETVLLQIDEAVSHGLVVAIDIHSGEFELGTDAIEATEKLGQRVTEPEVWLERVG